MVKSNCYKCDTEIEVISDRLVHPLCAECQESFDDWFEHELGVFKNA